MKYCTFSKSYPPWQWVYSVHGVVSHDYIRKYVAAALDLAVHVYQPLLNT